MDSLNDKINNRRIKELEDHIIPKTINSLKNTSPLKIREYRTLQMRLEEYALEYRERTGRPYKYE